MNYKLPPLNVNPPNMNRLIAEPTNITEVPAGNRAVLNCDSNDDRHNFMYWIVNSNRVIGPTNPYDVRKYKFEILSGRLHIDNVSPSESGSYKCVSKELGGGAFSIREVEMIVKSAFSAMDAVKLVAIVVSIIVLISCAVIYYRLKKEWSKYDGRTVVPVDEDDEEMEGDEIYNRTTTSINQQAAPMPGPSRNQSSEHLLYGIDNQGLDTDFNSVFENIQIKSPPSLI